MVSCKAWLVDLDGTLYFEAPVKIAMAAELALNGPTVWAMIRAFRDEHQRLREDLTEPVTNPFALQLGRAAERRGCPPGAMQTAVEEWMFRRPLKWLRLFRRRSLLDEIRAFRRAAGSTALVSDYPARAKLEALGVIDLFDVVVANGEDGCAGRLKPWPDGYLMALDQLGRRPSECLVLGDRPELDGEAARRAQIPFRRVG